jgi:hypothetical protein
MADTSSSAPESSLCTSVAGVPGGDDGAAGVAVAVLDGGADGGVVGTAGVVRAVTAFVGVTDSVCIRRWWRSAKVVPSLRGG